MEEGSLSEVSWNDSLGKGDFGRLGGKISAELKFQEYGVYMVTTA
jgi:hypothetical protein